ncbi:hypothetical protein [Lapidilactobacillus luobeiensis]|uniref:hypothetical protein n=1 Tax=Lapidilactobacillus luobeiensis TaxID=2950371 RepID=UPI0021C30480|nr:hypothetical protein [Lapidilactobacillus luobeiensis]
MISENMLYWSSWRDLTAEVQQKIFEQVLRYFVNPLWTVERIQYVETPSADQTWRTFTVDLNGQSFFFMPGQEAGELVAHSTNVAPFLMSVQAIPAGLKLIGELDQVTGASQGDQRLLKKYQTEIKAYLDQRQATLDPFAVDDELADTGDLFFAPVDDHATKVFLLKDFTFDSLRQELRRDGANLPTRNQWEYAASANLPASFANYQPTAADHQLGLGMMFDDLPTVELLDDPIYSKGNPFMATAALLNGVEPAPLTADVLAERLFAVKENGFSGKLPLWAAYRSVFNIQLD